MTPESLLRVVENYQEDNTEGICLPTTAQLIQDPMLDITPTATIKEEADEIDTLFGFSNDRRAPIDLTQDDDEFPDVDDVRALTPEALDSDSSSDDSNSDSEDDSIKSDSDRRGKRNVIVIPDIPEHKDPKLARPISDADRAPPTPEPRGSDSENDRPPTEQRRLRRQM